MRFAAYALLASLGLCFLCCASASSDDSAEMRALLEEFRQENAALRDQVGRLLTRVDALERASTGQAQPAPNASALSRDYPQGLPEELPEELGIVRLPRLRIQGFSDTLFQLSSSKVEEFTSFGLGSVDLYMNSEVTDRVNVVVEADFGANTGTNSVTFFLQRALVRYAHSDRLNVVTGKMHMPMGFWNQAYHHGAWVQTSINRPDIVLFEFDDGFLPMHQLGVDVFGVAEFEVGDVGYNLGVYNGRGRSATEQTIGRDKNDDKAVNLHLNFRPALIDGLTVGGNVYRDEIPSNPPTAARREGIDEWIFGQYATYDDGDVQVLSELYEILHNDKTSGSEYNTIGAYLQAGYRIQRVMPYYRIDFVDTAAGDPFWAAPRNIDRVRNTLGLRWNFLPWNALKFEYGYGNFKKHANEHTFGADWSFAF